MEKIIRKIRQFLKLDYPFEVFYEDGSRSWKPEKDKKPWGIFFGNGIISLKEPDIEVPFAEAKVFQQDIAHKVATSGSKDFWESVAKQGVPALQKLNAFIEKLGGKRLNGFCHTSTPRHAADSFFYYADNERSYTNIGNNYMRKKIRPVIEG